MSVFGVRKEFSDVNTPKTSISASAAGMYKMAARSKVRNFFESHLLSS